MPDPVQHRLVTALLAAAFAAACTGEPNELPESGVQLFEGPVVTPLALSGDTLVRVNPVQNSITVFDLADPEAAFDVPVGVEPVSVAFRPGDPTTVLVANHVSDSISVVDLSRKNVVQTLQGFDEDGVSTTNEPTGVAFAGPDRAFVTLDQPGEVLVLDRVGGVWEVADVRLAITAPGPRALAVAGDRLYVAAFESGNQTVAASCGPGVSFPCWPTPPLNFLGGSATETIVLPVEVDANAPDRDLFVFDLTQLELPAPPLDANGDLPPVEVLSGVGTLLYGVAASGSTLFVSNTEALNADNGGVLETNRMFANRLTRLDCSPGCGIPQHVDLDQAAGIPVPTPYGVAVSGDGQTVVVTAGGAEAGPLLLPSQYMPGLFVFDANGQELGHVAVGSIPQGVVLRSDAAGAAQTAYVWNSYNGSVSVVDLAGPSAPFVTATLAAAPNPVPGGIRAGRLLFRSARTSTSNSFSCESCHPNGHTDQLIWVLNAPGVPNGGARIGEAGPSDDPESRVTQSVRGLRDTLPLHWDGSLAKPVPAVGNVRPIPQSCNFAESTDPALIDLDCFRQLVDASLAGVMCDQDPGACPVTEGLPGEVTGLERNFLAAYTAAVAPHPGPARRPDDQLSEVARHGIQLQVNFLPEGALGPLGGCTKTGTGCHEFPLGTPPQIATGFAGQPGPFRALWDRNNSGSNGGPSSHAHMQLLNPGAGYDPAQGPSPRSAFRAFVRANFLISDIDMLEAQFQHLLETSAGYSGLLGRQLTLSPAMVATPEARAAVLAEIEPLEQAAEEGRINLVGRLNSLFFGEQLAFDGAYNVDLAVPCWELTEETTTCYPTSQLLQYFATMPASARVTIRADLPAQVAQPPSGYASDAYRQPLLRYDNPSGFIVLEPETGTSTLRVTAWYVTDFEATAIYVDGARCAACTIGPITPPLDPGETHNVEVALSPLPAPGLHTLQIQAQRGWFSNDLPFRVPE
jgi:DNA-binding beta-propeller fold protein YncE